MWILKNSKDLLEYIESRSLSSYNSIKTFDFSFVYVPFSPLKPKTQIKTISPTVIHKTEFPT
jgi:hypothetical protein